MRKNMVFIPLINQGQGACLFTIIFPLTVLVSPARP